MKRIKEKFRQLLAEKEVREPYWAKAVITLIIVIWAASFLTSFFIAIAALTITGFALAIIGLKKQPIGLYGIGMLCALDALSRIFLAGKVFLFHSLNYFLIAASAVYLAKLWKLKNVQITILTTLVALLIIELPLNPNFLSETFTNLSIRAVVSPKASSGATHILNILSVFGLIVFVMLAGKTKNAWNWLALIIGILTAAGGAAFYLQKNALPYVNPNSLTYFFLPALIAIAIANLSGERQRNNLAFTILAAINASWAFLPGARGGMLVAIVCIAAIFLSFKTKNLTKLKYAAIAIILFLALNQAFAPEAQHSTERIKKLVDTNKDLEVRTSGRSRILFQGINLFLANPMGVGTGEFAKKTTDEYKEDAHSAWLKVLAENGIIGITLFTAFILSFAVIGIKTKNKRLAFLGIFTTITMSIAFISTEFQPKPIWLLAAAAMVLLNKHELAQQWQGKKGDANEKPACNNAL